MSASVLESTSRIKINGQMYNFVYTNRAVVYLKGLYGGFQKAMDKMKAEDGDFDYDVLTELTYAALLCNKDQFTKESINDWLMDLAYMDTADLAGVKIPEAITATFPEAKENLK